MNKFFVCIKVDREERPDIDQIYMDAVQLMTGRGGWPLNCITLPDQKPIYGGTYFPKEQWRQVLLQVANYYKNDTAKCTQYADELTKGVQSMEMISQAIGENKSSINLDELYDKWDAQLDHEEGGPNRSPKFPMPDNYQYLLQYWYFSKNKKCEEHIKLTLHKLAYGGIYDQLGGGFARYSTDSLWKVPHFEKMLYDNAQLVSLYCKAFQAFKDPLYKSIVEETLSFISKEITSPNGGFYSALDADTEHVEGKFYTWSKQEIDEELKEDSRLFCDYFNVNERGFWEHDQYILLRHDSDEVIAQRNNITVSELRQAIANMKMKLFFVRNERVRPGLDDKIICSWNALMLKAYADAYLTFSDETYLKVAIENVEFIFNNLTNNSGGLMHTCKDEDTPYSVAVIEGFLEDYAYFIDALITFYQATFDEKYLLKAKDLLEYTINYFSDDKSGLFYFTSNLSEPLIARKIDVQDNVMPSANAMMAHNLFAIAKYFENEAFELRSKKMFSCMQESVIKSTPWFAHWAQFYFMIDKPVYEVVFVGEQASEKRNEWFKSYIPNSYLAGTLTQSDMPLLNNRAVIGDTNIYVCRDKTCFSPIKSVNEAISLTM